MRRVAVLVVLAIVVVTMFTRCGASDLPGGCCYTGTHHMRDVQPARHHRVRAR